MHWDSVSIVRGMTNLFKTFAWESVVSLQWYISKPGKYERSIDLFVLLFRASTVR